ncbi:DUF3256 family protein [uncultured Bacteroides sp.]|uniref:DUF3256 family protein n=1 Tax=uncultured Bacteroides sp. TaxID=162156 RepID=UPI00261A650E|nr:DUF3256 family protein [uncultured Bacteroides sp.]
MKRLILLFALLCSLVSAKAQDMKSLYVAMPDSLSPLLTEVNRADFGDFLASNMKAEVKNRFGKISEMKTMTDDYLYLKISEVNSEEMKLLPLNDSVKIICVVRTYMGPVADSRVSFYDTDWKELPANRYLTLPGEDDFYKNVVNENQIDSLNNLRLKADMYLLKAELSEKDNSLTFTYTTPQYLDKPAAEEIEKYLIGKPIRYRWTNGRFIRL